MGGTLPLAGAAMYHALTPHWAGTLLGLVQVAIIPIPVVFYKYGHRIRKRSILIQKMQIEKKRLAGRLRRTLEERREVTVDANVIAEKTG